MKRARIKRIFPGVPRISLLARRIKKEFCIVVSDCGEATDSLWFPPVPPREIEAYWSGQPSAETGKLPGHLGGEWIDQWEYWDVGRKAYDKFGALVSHLGSQERYSAVACCDDDSYLITPDDRVIVHAACTEQFRNHRIKDIEWAVAQWRSGYFTGRSPCGKKPENPDFPNTDKRKEQRLARRAAAKPPEPQTP